MDNEKTELLKETIERIMKELNSCENPEKIEAVKKLIKKNVPLTRRGYFSAMLLLEVVSKKERKDIRKENAQSPIKKDVPKEKEIHEGSKTLYLNIGKMKHLYAKNLSLLLQKELGITRDDIYSLRVHDKYSFITMSEENCEKAICLLSGRDINGRTAELSYSHK